MGQLANAFNAMADNLNRHETLRKQFTADISHELRTPLTSIKSYIENIKIKNTGMGISEDDLPLIFERFYRADKSRTRETGGTGIGLALVRQVTDLHQGTITVQVR